MRKNLTNNINLRCLLVFALLFSIALALPKDAFAAHTANVTITPSIANCEQLGDTFTVNVKNNNVSADAIFEVRIYKGTYGMLNFSCGPAPYGWTLSDYAGGSGLPDYGYCEYKTAWDNNTTVIIPGAALDFTFDATMWSEACYSQFLISTLDNKRPVGEHNYYWPQVYIDCFAPVIGKDVVGPQIGDCPPEIPGDECWVMDHYTNIIAQVYDNNSTSMCNLGIDYCTYKILLDGQEIFEHTFNPSNPEPQMGWQLNFTEDSEHTLIITCVDIAGNIAVDTEVFKVDSTAPKTTKTYGDPHYPSNMSGSYPHWITTHTPITLTAVDGGDICHVDGVITYYRDFLVLDEFCEGVLPCEPGSYGNPELKFTVYGGPFLKEEESCHVIEFYSVDALGNEEPLNWQCVYVEDTPPAAIKTVGEPNIYWSEIIEAADRIIDLQCTNGSWDWVVTDATGPTGTTYLNIAGVTAEVLIDAYKISGETKYMEAAIKAGDYLINEIGTPSASQRHNAFTIVFLYELADMTGKLAYEDLADAILHHILYENNYWSNKYGSHCGTGCTASELLEALKEYRSSFGDPNGVVPWDLFKFVEAAQIGEESSFATNMANEIDAYLDQASYNDTVESYALGLSAGIIGLGMKGINYSDHLAKLLAEQGSDGSFGDIQTTAYALMALEFAEEIDEAELAARFLVSELGYGSIPDGWQEVDGEEYSEVTSEAAQGIFDFASEKGFWVRDHETEITLDCDDTWDSNAPHPVDHEKMCYRISFDEDPWYLTREYCALFGGAYIGEGVVGWCCVDTGNIPYTFNFTEDSLHDLEFYCEDALGNRNYHETEFFRVDSQPPNITKTMLGDEDIDWVGNCPPREMGDVCYVADNDVGGVHVDVWDGGDICAVDDSYCTYGLWWLTDETTCREHQYYYWDESGQKCNVEAGGFGEEGIDILFHEDSTHVLYINCWDALGNEMEQDVETFLVDSTPPVTTKVYGNPHYPADINTPGPYPHYITSNTPITLTPTDNKVGVDKTFWSVTLVEDRYCYTEYSGCQNYEGQLNSWNEYIMPFNINESSCHLIEFYSVDFLGNTEQTKRQCVFVDNTPPETVKEVGDPKFLYSIEPEIIYYVSGLTPITMNCTDNGDHPVDHVSLHYRYRVSNDCQSWGNWTIWMEPVGEGNEKTMYFPEDSCHQLEYYCEDALGNEETHKYEIDVVDNQAPVITRNIDGPKYWYNDKWYIDGITLIKIDAVDPQPHPVDQVTCDWDYEVLDGQKMGSGQTGLIPPFSIDFPEESTHNLTVICRDRLNNTSVYNEIFVVDESHPVIDKWYEGSQVPSPLTMQTPYPHWISSDTIVHLDVYDPQPHPSGLASVEYSVSLVDDIYCMDEYLCQLEAVGDDNWMPYQGPFNINETSCHLIEVYAVDNVEKDSYHRQCVFVDNEGPDTNKTVGEKKFTWDGSDAYYYPWIADYCWNGYPDTQIDCWKVTTTTPITMDCEDKLPHPVGREHVCFNVELDGDDHTQYYCGMYKGTMEENGYCCVTGIIENFFFLEESEHNLEYYCVDALGNEGPVDEEKFKVHGETFEIELLKKWNLISVPFVLMDSNIEVVFEDIASDVISVWTYDNKDWFVWTPDDSDTDTLFDIRPGVGYWVLMNKSATLTIGGSLLSEGPNGPPDNQLEPGWNLIGYYAATSMFNCGYLDETTTNWYYSNPVYCSLNSLVDTQEGYPKWSALWTYYNYGTSSEWVGLNACCETSQWGGFTWCPNSMYAGQGYWVEIDVADLYSPATNCIWNKDFTCIWNY